MSKPTIKDVARAANLSPATVDRALNGRGGVSKRALEKIRSAAFDLGYGTPVLYPSKPTARILIILPRGDYGFIRNVRDATRTAVASQTEIEVSLEIVSVPITAKCLVAELERALQKDLTAIGIFAVDVPEVRNAVNKCESAGIRVVTMVSDVPSSARRNFVGIDNSAAGRTAGRLMGKMLRGETGKVGVITGSMQIRDHMERFFGFREIILTSYKDLAVLPVLETDSLNDANYDAVLHMCDNNPDLVGIYTATGGVSGVIAGVNDRRPNKRPILIAHDVTTHTRRGLLSGDLDVIINQSAEQIAFDTIEIMLGDLFPNETTRKSRKASINIEIFVADNLPN